MAILWLDVWVTLRLVSSFSFSGYLLIALLKVTTYLPLDLPATNILLCPPGQKRETRR